MIPIAIGIVLLIKFSAGRKFSSPKSPTSLSCQTVSQVAHHALKFCSIFLTRAQWRTHFGTAPLQKIGKWRSVLKVSAPLFQKIVSGALDFSLRHLKKNCTAPLFSFPQSGAPHFDMRHFKSFIVAPVIPPFKKSLGSEYALAYVCLGWLVRRMIDEHFMQKQTTKKRCNILLSIQLTR